MKSLFYLVAGIIMFIVIAGACSKSDDPVDTIEATPTATITPETPKPTAFPKDRPGVTIINFEKALNNPDIHLNWDSSYSVELSKQDDPGIVLSADGILYDGSLEFTADEFENEEDAKRNYDRLAEYPPSKYRIYLKGYLVLTVFSDNEQTFKEYEKIIEKMTP
ncbi:MAG: hypothetical protein ACE3L7_07195 [Candidatus Pristimantibacillus sp.]